MFSSEANEQPWWLPWDQGLGCLLYRDTEIQKYTNTQIHKWDTGCKVYLDQLVSFLPDFGKGLYMV
jgi:hypothetical protein